MKQLFFIVALAGILLQNFSKLIILAYFELNKDYIAKNLCVKKDIPNNYCKGKCHLKKQLDEEEKKEQAPPVRNLKEIKEFQLYCQQALSMEFLTPCFAVKHYSHYYLSKITSPSFSIFHPPKC